MTAQISLFDQLPTDMPGKTVTATLYGKVNEAAGHLLIESPAGDWLFLNTGRSTITCCLPGWDTAVDLTAEQLRELGDYCHRVAYRIENR